MNIKTSLLCKDAETYLQNIKYVLSLYYKFPLLLVTRKRSKPNKGMQLKKYSYVRTALTLLHFL